MISITLQAETVTGIFEQMRTFMGGALLNPHADITKRAVDKYVDETSVGSTSDTLKEPVDVQKYAPGTENVHNYATKDVGSSVEVTGPVMTNAPAPEKQKRTRKPKESKELDSIVNDLPPKTDLKTVAASPTTAAPAVSESVPSNPTVAEPQATGKEAVHQALQQVNVAIGLNKAREILAEFKINRISEIKPEQYKAFVDKCNEAVMNS